MHEGKKMLQITIDEKNKIYLLSSHRAMVDCKKIGKKMYFINGDNGKPLEEIYHLLTNDSFDIL